MQIVQCSTGSQFGQGPGWGGERQFSACYHCGYIPGEGHCPFFLGGELGLWPGAGISVLPIKHLKCCISADLSEGFEGYR